MLKNRDMTILHIQPDLSKVDCSALKNTVMLLGLVKIFGWMPKIAGLIEEIKVSLSEPSPIQTWGRGRLWVPYDIFRRPLGNIESPESFRRSSMISRKISTYPASGMLHCSYKLLKNSSFNSLPVAIIKVSTNVYAERCLCWCELLVLVLG